MNYTVWSPNSFKHYTWGLKQSAQADQRGGDFFAPTIERWGCSYFDYWLGVDAEHGFALAGPPTVRASTAAVGRIWRTVESMRVMKDVSMVGFLLPRILTH
jgi:hypothetical protein